MFLCFSFSGKLTQKKMPNEIKIRQTGVFIFKKDDKKWREFARFLKEKSLGEKKIMKFFPPVNFPDVT